MQIPLDPSIKDLASVPHTISYVIRKRQQIDGLYELPKDKRPPDSVLWDGTPEDLDDWLDKIFDRRKNETDVVGLELTNVEG